MGVEMVNMIAEVDPVPTDSVVIAVDPVDLTSISIAEPLPLDMVFGQTNDSGTDVPPDAQTFGGPVDSAPTGEAPIISYENMRDLTAEWSTEFQPKADASGDTSSADAGSADTGAADAGSGDAGASDGTTPVDDGGMIMTMFVDGTPVGADGTSVDATATDGTPTDGTSTDGSGDIVIDRPVDPEPNWRTLGGEGGSDAGGSTGGDTGTDGSTDTPLSYEDFVSIYEKGGPVMNDDGTPPGVYTMAGGAFEPRSAATPAVAPVAEVDHTPVHYAASEPFHTGLDLL